MSYASILIDQLPEVLPEVNINTNPDRVSLDRVMVEPNSRYLYHDYKRARLNPVAEIYGLTSKVVSGWFIDSDRFSRRGSEPIIIDGYIMDWTPFASLEEAEKAICEEYAIFLKCGF